MRLREEQAKRYDVRELREKARAEQWPDGKTIAIRFRAPHTGNLLLFPVAVRFTEGLHGGRRIWFACPSCSRRVTFLFGGRPHVSRPYAVACCRCQGIAYRSEYEGPARRWQRQLRKLEARLGGDPRNLTPPRGRARSTFERLAARHTAYRDKLVAHAERRLQAKLRNRLLPTDPAELRAMRAAYGLLSA